MQELDIVYATGDSNSCCAVTTKRKVVLINKPLLEYHKYRNQFDDHSLIKVNLTTLINTRHFVKKLNKREILLKDGSIHKVSRKVWKEL